MINSTGRDMAQYSLCHASMRKVEFQHPYLKKKKKIEPYYLRYGRVETGESLGQPV